MEQPDNVTVGEIFVQGKNGDDTLCEDVIHLSKHFIAILDGATIGPWIDGKPSGRILSDCVSQALFDVPSDADIESATKLFNRKIRERFGYKSSLDVMQRNQRAAASAVIYSAQRRELWIYGDTMISLDGKVIDVSKRIDSIVTAARCTYVAELLASGRTEDAVMSEKLDFAAIRDLLALQQQSFLNRVGPSGLGYANIDGADEVLALTKTIDVSSAHRIILASDGYPFLRETLEETEAAVKDVLDKDPCMWNLYPQVKGLPHRREDKKALAPWFDDRSWIEFVQR